ncbi:MAG: mannose-1-phosphate guanylyltransferase [Kiritimatiellae bacterium]|nr:mannose-1-phosphate guanylyltransferase [Kiritimatiellia bacterium]
MSVNAYAVIMAGGKGERFWPLSTAGRPKQVLSLVGGKPLMQTAIERLEGIIPPERVIVITGADIVDITCKSAPQLPKENVIGEPFGRDTAAAVALASAIVKERDPDGVFCILTADHIIQDINLFQTTLREAIEMAATEDVLVTIGMQVLEPSTAFGYIESGEPVANHGEIQFLRVKRFIEKPDKPTAQKYLDAGVFYWNSGMFIWSVASIQKALASFTPELMTMANNMEACVGTPGFASSLEKEYGKLEKISVDYAIMEKADNIIMAKGVFDWGDIGSWDALEKYFDKDDSGNVVIGEAELLDSSENIVVSDSRITALIGVKDLVVVQAKDVTMICRKDCAQDVKKMVHQLRDAGEYDGVL